MAECYALTRLYVGWSHRYDGGGNTDTPVVLGVSQNLEVLVLAMLGDIVKEVEELNSDLDKNEEPPDLSEARSLLLSNWMYFFKPNYQYNLVRTVFI